MLARERERPEPERLSLAAVVEAAAERWEGPAESSGHRLSAGGEGAPVVAATDADLAVILDNLVENALNYSPAGTAVAIEWGADGASAWVAVLDEGPGTEPAERDQVFERFYRGAASRGGAAGTGLGLSVVEALARRWDGSVKLRVRDRFGLGARPAAAAAPPGCLPGTLLQPPAAPHGARRRARPRPRRHLRRRPPRRLLPRRCPRWRSRARTPVGDAAGAAAGRAATRARVTAPARAAAATTDSRIEPRLAG
jgi:signal transduction histidine kinase